MKPIVTEGFVNIVSILLFTFLLFIVHTMYGGKNYFIRRLGPGIRRFLDISESGTRDLGVYYKRLCAFVLFIVFPIIIIRGIYHESVKNYGLSRPTGRLSPFFIIPVLLMSFLVLFFFSKKKKLKRRYPEVQRAKSSKLHFALSSASYMLYFLGYENLYRGFLLFGLRAYTGDWPAVLVSAGFTTLTHFRDPKAVVLGSLFGGLLFSYIALITGSIWTVFVLHSGIGIAMDYFCIRASVPLTAVRAYQKEES
jgi:membrane protease YdiL (CAAX protease family)